MICESTDQPEGVSPRFFDEPDASEFRLRDQINVARRLLESIREYTD